MTIHKNSYRWPRRPLIDSRGANELIDNANRAVFNEQSIEQYGRTVAVPKTRHQQILFAVMMTQDEVDDCNYLDSETAGLLTRSHTPAAGDEAVDDDMISAWCALLELSQEQNVRFKRLQEPVLVYFPMLHNLVDGQLGEGCEAIRQGEVLPITFNTADGRWESIRPTVQGDRMDVVTVCNNDIPAEDCYPEDEDPGPCCLFDGMAFRILPDCEDSSAYFCAPDNQVFDVWVYVPDKAALPPEGVADWGRRIQDSYTVQDWQPFGDTGPTFKSTRPVYQIAAVSCGCPNDQAKITMWCSENGQEESASGFFDLRNAAATEDDIPLYDYEESYDVGAMVYSPTKAPGNLYVAIDDVPPDKDPDEGWPEYWSSAELDDRQVYQGEFCISHKVPLVVSDVICDTDCGEFPFNIGFCSWDPLTGQPLDFWYDDGDGNANPAGFPGGLDVFEQNWIFNAEGTSCRLGSEMGPSYDGATQTVTTCYRIKFFCTQVPGLDYGLTSAVSSIQLFLLIPEGHYGEAALGLEGQPLSDDDRIIGGPISADELNPCIGRTMGKFTVTDMGSSGVVPQEGPLRFTPHLNYACALGCGQLKYDLGEVDEWCSCNGKYHDSGGETEEDCSCEAVYFMLTFNCFMGNPV